MRNVLTLSVAAALVASPSFSSPLVDHAPPDALALTSACGSASDKADGFSKIRIGNCESRFESDLQACYDNNVVSPNNGAYAICVNVAHAVYRFCRMKHEN